MKTIYGIVADMRFCPSVLAAAVLAVVVGPANAADDSIEEKAALCTPCHGEAGISETENTPSLAGQPDPFLQWQLVFFRSGSRKNDVMRLIAEQINNEDVRNLGALFCLADAAKSFRTQRQSRFIQEGCRGGRRTALWVMPRRYICRNESACASRRPTRGLPGEGAA